MTTDALEEIVTKEQGKDFVNWCGDTNPIHTKGNIVQGVQLISILAKALDTYQYNKPINRIKRLEIEFSDFVIYDEPIHPFLEPPVEEDSNIKITCYGRKHDEKDFIKIEAMYSQKLERKQREDKPFDYSYKKSIEINERNRFCNIIGIQPEFMDSAEALKGIFVSSFIVSALCQFIDPTKLPEGKIPVFAKQKYNFYDCPKQERYDVEITMNRTRDTEVMIGIRGKCYLSDLEIIDYNFIIFKKRKEDIKEIFY